MPLPVPAPSPEPSPVPVPVPEPSPVPLPSPFPSPSPAPAPVSASPEPAPPPVVPPPAPPPTSVPTPPPPAPVVPLVDGVSEGMPVERSVEGSCPVPTARSVGPAAVPTSTVVSVGRPVEGSGVSTSNLKASKIFLTMLEGSPPWPLPMLCS